MPATARKSNSRLTLIKSLPDKDNIPRVLCRCDCGQLTQLNKYAFTSGQTLSCGCLQKEEASRNALSLINKIYGNLHVIEKTSDRYYNSVVWECLCSCGTLTTASTNQLQTGTKKSCGCLKRERIAQKLKVGDKLYTLKQLASLTKIEESVIRYRIDNMGLSPEEAINPKNSLLLKRQSGSSNTQRAYFFEQQLGETPETNFYKVINEAKLSAVEQQILYGRFVEKISLQDIGNRLGRSREWVRQKESLALSKIAELRNSSC